MTTRRPAPVDAIDRSSSRPLWSQVQTDIERRLRTGEFTDGFPGELALVEQYAVSRHTVRQALRQLRESGLLDAGRGRQSRVADTAVTAGGGTLYSLFTAARDSGHTQRSVVRRLEPLADGTVAARLGLEESTPLVHLERLRLLDDQPFALDRVWLPAAVATPLLGADFGDTSLYDELERRCGVRLTGGRETVRAVVPTPAEQMLLDLDGRTAALAIDRLGELRGQPLEWRHTLVRGDRFSLVTDHVAAGTMTMSLDGRTRPRRTA
ncbi:GntR family transcriptional regulator [Nocardioidaceae bacterium]|nr:GntR family transcriptional regulator [Nocardioidaceae bacterium]